MRALAFERGVALGSNSQSKRILDELIVFAKETGAFEKREIRQKLADIAVDIQALKLMVLESEWKADRGDVVVAEPSRDKAYNDGVWERLAQIGTEILGAYAEVDPIALKTKWTKAKGMAESLYWGSPGMSIAAGTTDTMRNIIAQFGLGLPKPY